MLRRPQPPRRGLTSVLCSLQPAMPGEVLFSAPMQSTRIAGPVLKMLHTPTLAISAAAVVGKRARDGRQPSALAEAGPLALLCSALLGL
jgi:hypothetical protein